MKISNIALGQIETNCYIISDEQTGIGAVVDPAVCNEKLLKMIAESGMKKLQCILITHGHFDHIMGIKGILEKYPDAKVVISEEDSICLSDSKCALLEDGVLENDPIKYDITVNDGDVLEFGSMEIKVISTPGHTSGSVCYIIGDSMFSGDTLFCRTCGRTDLFRGSSDDMHESILKLGKLDGNYDVYPGHGIFTDLDTERKTNRFMRKIKWSLL